MATTLAWCIWGAAAIGYIAMLVITERGAARYVRGETRRRPRPQVHVHVACRSLERAPHARVQEVMSPEVSPEAA